MAGMTPREGTIMDAWDDGQSMQDIARDLRMPLRQVRKIVTNFSGTDKGRAGKRLAKGSATLAAAVNAARGG